MAQSILICLVRVYRAVLSPPLSALFGPLGFGCRFNPTCSQYALQAVQIHGAWKGSVLAARRLCRCHPWGGAGVDPVPEKDPGCTPPPRSSLSCQHRPRQSHPQILRPGTTSG